MKKDGSVAHTVGRAYSLTALSATSGLSKNGVTAHTVATPRRKRKQLWKIKLSFPIYNIEWQILGTSFRPWQGNSGDATYFFHRLFS